jgi:hypothetical protein
MQENHNTHNDIPEDQDIQFDMHETSTTAISARPEDYDAGSGLEKKEQLSRKEFRPLTDQEKQPKMNDYDRIKEMNRRTAIDD